ncbi:nucleoside 2-deoxyribosyltransferase [Burkholderia diffusa]|uniref:nucleoside 2-deoxyribosyltransferase n=1 Tax=Burkholderia diffusa TaxID=488732 RepID=UPI002ABE54E8|nr:nucleoside 2-deoxyribosyltransferase [Burkholderia diffusa]
MSDNDTDKPFAFVLMPFHEAFNDVYQVGIKETAVKAGFICERVDEQIYQESMLERIYRQIDAADVIIADMSGKNPNVFYEVGYAHAKGKLVILLTSDSGDIPFDLKHHRHIVYNSSTVTLRKQLAPDLGWALNEIQNLRNSRIKVVMQEPSGLLEKSSWKAVGEIDFKFDLSNLSSQVSPDIEAVYVYTSKRWEVKQDERECSRGESDWQPFKERHFLACPVRRLQKNGGWAQIKFSMKRTLATTVSGEELKDSYRLRGKLGLRIVTSNGNFDHEFALDVEIDEVPF